MHRTTQTLVRFQATDLCRRMGGAARRFHKVPYTVTDDVGRLELGVIDALFQGEVRWSLVEPKTDRIEGPDALEAKLARDDYVPQMARYLKAAERRLGHPPRPVPCLLNYPSTVHMVGARW